MKFKKRYFIIIFLVIFISITFLTYQFKSNDLKYLLKKVNDNNAVTSKANIDMTKYMYSYNSNNFGISKNDLKCISSALQYSNLPQYNNSTELNKSCAISDVEFLFNLLRYSYAGYEYFGGDAAFDSVKNNIIKTVNSIQKDKITSMELERILCTNLSFVQDGHFSINNKSMLNTYCYYSNENFSFTKSGSNYYTYENGTKVYIKSINDNANFEDYMKLSIDANGKLCYYIGQLANSNSYNNLKLLLQSKNHKIIRYVQLNKSISTIKYSDKKSYEYSKKNNIPIITMRRMCNVSSNDNSIDLFSKSAKALKNQKIFILDIRGNHGGQDIGSVNWFKNYIGEMPKVNNSSIQLCSLINNYITTLGLKDINYESLPTELKNEYNEQVKKSKDNTNKWYTSKSKVKLHDNSSIIFVLVDNNVASSGEAFISYLKTLKNVILVGTNTSGVLLSCVYTQSQLPNSLISVKFGNTLTFIPQFKEGIGYSPDIWINSGDSLDRVLKLINKNSGF